VCLSSHLSPLPSPLSPLPSPLSPAAVAPPPCQRVYAALNGNGSIIVAVSGYNVAAYGSISGTYLWSKNTGSIQQPPTIDSGTGRAELLM
jgi:hypothetical protein